MDHQGSPPQSLLDPSSFMPPLCPSLRKLWKETSLFQRPAGWSLLPCGWLALPSLSDHLPIIHQGSASWSKIPPSRGVFSAVLPLHSKSRSLSMACWSQQCITTPVFEPVLSPSPSISLKKKKGTLLPQCPGVACLNNVCLVTGWISVSVCVLTTDLWWF